MSDHKRRLKTLEKAINPIGIIVVARENADGTLVDFKEGTPVKPPPNSVVIIVPDELEELFEDA